MIDQASLDQLSPAERDTLEQQQSQVRALNEATQRWDRGEAVPQGVGMAQAAGSPGGLGMARDQPETSPPTETSRDIPLSFAQRLEAAGAVSRGGIPLYLQEQKLDLERQQMQGQMADRRALAAEKLLQTQQTQRQQHFSNFITLDKQFADNPEMWETQMKQQAANGNPDARMALGVGDKKMQGEWESVVPLIQTYFPDVAQRYAKDPASVSKSEMRAVLSNASEIKKKRTIADADAMEYGTLQKSFERSQLTGEQMHGGDLERFQELHGNKTKKSLELAKLQADIAHTKAQTAKAMDPTQVSPDHSEANRYHESMFSKPWSQGTPDTQSKALAAKSKAYAEGKMVVTGDTPLGQLGKAQEMRDPVTGKAAPGWMPQSQALKMGYVNIEPTQVNTINQLNNVDASMKEILAAGSSLLRRDTGAGLFEIPRGMLQTPLVSLFKKYAGDPDAQVLQSAIKRISPSLSRLGGDVGNIAVAEQQLYADSIFNDADTLESFTKKIQSIMSAQHRARASMGFVPDEASYVRRLVIQGKSDAEIKAMLEERKRTQ